MVTIKYTRIYMYNTIHYIIKTKLVKTDQKNIMPSDSVCVL